MKIISGSSHKTLATFLSREMNIELLETSINKFGDGELNLQIHGKISKEVIIVQSTSSPVNDHLMELLLLSDAAKRAGASRIIAVIPYFGYSRQDRCTSKNSPISASLVIKMIESAGINEVITLDLHSDQLEGFFNIPVANLSTESIFFPLLKQKKIVVVSPDIGGVQRARIYSSLLGCELAIISKKRDLDNICSVTGIMGDVKGKDCVIVDDIIDGASTVCLATDMLYKEGANNVEAIITHGVLSGDARAKITQSGLNKLYITDSIDIKEEHSKITILPIYKLLAVYLKSQ
jgi:ribose-phosphate pyrophosphokinase